MIERIFTVINFLWFNVAFIELCLIYEYIYGFSFKKKYKQIAALSSIILAANMICLVNHWSDEVSVIAILVAVKILFFVNTDKHRYRHSLWMWPIICTGALPSVLVENLLRIMGVQSKWWGEYVSVTLSEGIFIVLLVILYCLNNKKGISTPIKGKDRYLIAIASMIAAYVGVLLGDDETNQNLVQYKNQIFVLGWLMIVVLVMLMMWIMVKENRLQYYKTITRLNEKHIEEAYEHFKAYKLVTNETRKLRHDMKNHLLCIQTLYQQREYERLEEYLASLTQMTNERNTEIITGNEMVDTVFSAKKQRLNKANIKLELSGRLCEVKWIRPIDWSTIFSNAIDNAIEELVQVEGEKILAVSFKSNEHFLVIRFRNKCNAIKEIKNNKIKSSKKRWREHGFGLENIKDAAERYSGTVHIEYINEQETNYFELSILLPMQFVTSL